LHESQDLEACVRGVEIHHGIVIQGSIARLEILRYELSVAARYRHSHAGE
jgi:hypothetical protein